MPPSTCSRITLPRTTSSQSQYHRINYLTAFSAVCQLAALRMAQGDEERAFETMRVLLQEDPYVDANPT